MRKYWILLALVVFSGCTFLSEAELPSLGPDVSLSVMPSPTHTSTPFPTPTPTPTPQPSEILDQADHAYSLGDWESAEAGYQQILPLSYVTQEQAVHATLGLGKTLLAGGSYSDGIALLDAFLQSAPDVPQAAEAHLALADTLLEYGDAALAVEHYQAVLEALPSLAPYAHEWLGDACFSAGDASQALAHYQAALALATTTGRQAFLWEKIALTHAGLQSYEEALAAYDAILAIARVPYYRARIAFQAAETASLFGDVDEARKRLYEVVQAYPEEASAYQALVQLVEAGQPVDPFLRGYIDYYAGAYGPAVQAFYAAMEADPEHTGEPHYYAALSYLEAGSPQLALAEFEILLDTHPGDAYWGSAWIGKARALVALERVDEAIAAYRELPDVLPDHPRAAESLWEAAELLEEAGRLEEAAAAFSELADRYPEDSGAPEARFRAGLDAYRDEKFDSAKAAWDALLLWYPADARAQAAHFWIGKTALQVGDTVSATAAFSQAVAFDAWDYYGLRASDLLEDRAPFTASGGAITTTYDASAAQQEALDWMSTWLGADPLPVLDVPPDALVADPRLERGITLLRLGHFDEGREALESLREAYSEDALAQFHLALIFQEIGLYRSSILAASTVWRLSPVDQFVELPEFLGRLIYPTYFGDLVESDALEFGFQPLALYALLRQESLFEGFATSYAAAHGLMQVIPSTGEQIAAALGWPPEYETSDLYRPIVSVRFGTWYLAQQRDRFEGELYPALAGYNGGPGNAAAWWDAAGEDRDLFVELIGFQETRTYVERITEHYAKYQWLYGGY